MYTLQTHPVAKSCLVTSDDAVEESVAPISSEELPKNDVKPLEKQDEQSSNANAGIAVAPGTADTFKMQTSHRRALLTDACGCHNCYIAKKAIAFAQDSSACRRNLCNGTLRKEPHLR